MFSEKKIGPLKKGTRQRKKQAKTKNRQEKTMRMTKKTMKCSHKLRRRFSVQDMKVHTNIYIFTYNLILFSCKNLSFLKKGQKRGV